MGMIWRQLVERTGEVVVSEEMVDGVEYQLLEGEVEIVVEMLVPLAGMVVEQQVAMAEIQQGTLVELQKVEMVVVEVLQQQEEVVEEEELQLVFGVVVLLA